MGHVSTGMILSQIDCLSLIPQKSLSAPILAITIGTNSGLHNFKACEEPVGEGTRRVDSLLTHVKI